MHRSKVERVWYVVRNPKCQRMHLLSHQMKKQRPKLYCFSHTFVVNHCGKFVPDCSPSNSSLSHSSHKISNSSAIKLPNGNCNSCLWGSVTFFCTGVNMFYLGKKAIYFFKPLKFSLSELNCSSRHAFAIRKWIGFSKLVIILVWFMTIWQFHVNSHESTSNLFSGLKLRFESHK